MALLSFVQVRGFAGPNVSELFTESLREEKCAQCGALVSACQYEGAELTVKNPRNRWPDVLQTINHLVLHERVVEALNERALTGYRAHPLTMSLGSDRVPDGAPQYYLMEVEGRFDIEHAELDEGSGWVCPLCYHRFPAEDSRYRWAPKRLLPKLETWDGTDFVMIRNLRNGLIFCTLRFVELASDKRWTNFIFGERMPGVCMWQKPPVHGISYWDPRGREKYEDRVKAKHSDLR